MEDLPEWMQEGIRNGNLFAHAIEMVEDRDKKIRGLEERIKYWVDTGMPRGIW